MSGPRSATRFVPVHIYGAHVVCTCLPVGLFTGRLQKGGERYLLAADFDGVVAIFDMRRGRDSRPHLYALHRLHDSEILCMAFNEADGLLYTAGEHARALSPSPVARVVYLTGCWWRSHKATTARSGPGTNAGSLPASASGDARKCWPEHTKIQYLPYASKAVRIALTSRYNHTTVLGLVGTQSQCNASTRLVRVQM